jgi:hypothetical protein
MSLAGQISDTVTALASTRAARREALSGIRRDTARHLSEARTALERMAAAQQESLTEALRSTRLATAILIGAADEQIDGYRKERLKRADALSRELSEGADALRNGTRKWIGTQSAMRRKVAADALRRRRRDRATLARDVGALSKQNLSFLAALTSDRQKASAIWTGRNLRPAAPARAKAAPAVAPEVKQEVAKAEPVKAEPIKAEAPAPAPAPVRADVAKPEPAKSEPAKAAPVKAAPAKIESAAPGTKPSPKSDKA